MTKGLPCLQDLGGFGEVSTAKEFRLVSNQKSLSQQPFVQPTEARTESLSGLNVASYGLSIKGEDHKENEDTILVDDSRGLYAVADGVTYPYGGGQASRLATNSLKLFFKNDLNQTVKHINRVVLEEKKRDSKIGSTTLTLAHLSHSRFRIAHVGDSCALVIRNGKIVLKTVPQIRQGLLTNAIGEYFDEALINVQEIDSADHLILATDGVTAVLSEDEILRIVLDNKEPKGIVDYCIGEVGRRPRAYRDDRSMIVVKSTPS